MASAALARAVQFALNPPPPPTDEGRSADAELYSLPLVRDAEKCWRRRVLRQLLCWRVACHQVLLTELVDLEPKKTSEEAASVSEVPRRVVTRTELFLRTKLTPGKSLREGFTPVSECRHREIVRRGGKTFWFTCKGCQSRWPRVQDEVLESL